MGKFLLISPVLEIGQALYQMVNIIDHRSPWIHWITVEYGSLECFTYFQDKLKVDDQRTAAWYFLDAYVIHFVHQNHDPDIVRMSLHRK